MPPARPSGQPTPDGDTPAEGLPKIDVKPIDPQAVKIALLALGLLVVASVVLAFLPPAVAGWVMGGLLFLIAAWAGGRLVSGRGLRLGGRRAGGPRLSRPRLPGRAGGRAGRRPGARLGGLLRPGGRGPGRASNGRFSRPGGRLRNAAARRCPRAARALGRAGGKARSATARATAAAARAASRLPLPRRARNALATHAARAARRPASSGGSHRGPRPSRPSGRSGTSKHRPNRPGGSSGSSTTGGRKAKRPRVLGQLAGAVRDVIRGGGRTPSRPGGKTKNTTTGTVISTDDDLGLPDHDNHPPAGEGDDEPETARPGFWARLGYSVSDVVQGTDWHDVRTRWWGAATEPLKAPDPDLDPYAVGIDTGKAPPLPEGWLPDPEPPAPAPEPKRDFFDDDDGDEEPWFWEDGDPPPSPPPAEPDPSPHVSPNPVDQPEQHNPISIRSIPMAVDLERFQPHFKDVSTPAGLQQAYVAASQEAWLIGQQLAAEAKAVHADAMSGEKLPAAKAALQAEASKMEQDSVNYKNLATRWKNKAAEAPKRIAQPA